MAAIGGLDLSLISAQQKLALGLAHFNFDFSLVKIEAPAEYLTVGACLSKRRKQEAETGPLHIVARKLGALFASDIPAAPRLFRAYGQRASKIAGDPAFNPIGSRRDGAFADYVGADASSIWAAATSGDAAIAMHLLGCLLARIWQMPEATSILSEMVAARKAFLKRRTESDLFDISDAAAAEIVLSREQLAAWDASARAWLRTADLAYHREHQQLMQLISQSNSAMPTGNDVYAVVKKVWQSSIRTVEKLLSGESYRTSTSEPLLALLAWHLYPDMTIVGPDTADVLPEDPLFGAGGILTIGMPENGPQGKNGITWSLPLSHLRFYSKPVRQTHSLGLDSDRIYFDDLKYLVLGAVTGGWFTKAGGLSKVLDFLNALINCLRPHNFQAFDTNSLETNPDSVESDELPQWLEIRWQAAREIQSSQGQLRTDRERLYKLGHRRGLGFLSSTASQVPEAFGLTDFETFINQYSDHEEKIKTVRKLLPTLISDASLLQDGFISYINQNKLGAGDFPFWKHVESDEHTHPTHADSLPACEGWQKEVATIVPRFPLMNQHQRRIASLHSQDESDRGGMTTAYHSLTWEVPDMLSPSSTQVKRCSDLSQATGERCDLYLRPGHRLRRRPSIADWMDANEVPLRLEMIKFAPKPELYEMGNPFSHAPPEILQTSSANWGEAVLAAQRLGGFGNLGRDTKHPVKPFTLWGGTESDTLDASVHSAPVHRSLSLRRALRNAWFGPTDTLKQRAARKVGCATASSLKLPFCLRLRDAAERTHIPAKDMGCPQKYYVSSSVDAGPPTARYSLVASDSTGFGIWFPTPSAYQLQGVPFDEVITTLRQHADRKHLMRRLRDTWHDDDPSCWNSLNAFAAATTIFKHLPDTTISLSVIEQALCQSKWFGQDPSSCPLSVAYSCLALFETGSIDIDPTDLRDVMAMSAGNSLFMAEYIFSDPRDAPDVLIRRKIGNIGKPGVSFLLSARGLESLTPDYSTWKSVQYAPFDGKIEDNFAQTTLHLTLTGDEQPMNTGQSGYHDKQAFLVESVIRAFDKSRWVADVDTFFPTGATICRLGRCTHSEDERDDYSAFEPVTSIDSWDELLDLPRNTCIVRAEANWLARQAITAFAVQKIKPIVMASEVLCWACVARGTDNKWGIEPGEMLYGSHVLII